ncbi:MAG: hypothetical protein V1809_05470 [Planctomycetota bacterium]
MDWGTHVVLASKLLGAAGLDREAAIYSDLPVIDEKPAHFHRVYAHILENLPGFLDVAMEIFGSDEVSRRDFEALRRRVNPKIDALRREIAALGGKDGAARRQLEKKAYAYDRIADMTPVFLAHAQEAKALLGESGPVRISTHRMSAALSLVSHPYFDIWNNPVQPFLPGSSCCSGLWDFWNRIDYMKFRGDFYKPENIVPFRRAIAASPVWNATLRPAALIKAMIIRLGEHGQPSIPYEVVDMGVRDYLRAIDVNDYQRSDDELAFCRRLEDEITGIILKNYSRA